MIGQSDEFLMKKVKEGDLDKSAILFERYNIKIYNYFLRMTFDKQLSMDLSQNTFYKMLNYRKSYNPELSFKSWLFGVARNVFYDSVNSKHSKTDSIENLKTEKQIEHDDCIDQYENEALQHAMETLSEDDRELIIMSRFQDIKYAEIAEIQGLTISAVKVKIHRAIKKLRGHYFKNDISIQAN